MRARSSTELALPGVQLHEDPIGHDLTLSHVSDEFPQHELLLTVQHVPRASFGLRPCKDGRQDRRPRPLRNGHGSIRWSELGNA